MRLAPACSAWMTISPKRAKSAARIDGASFTAHLSACSFMNSLAFSFFDSGGLVLTSHLLQSFPFCLSHGHPYKDHGNRGSHRVKTIGSGKTNHFQQRQEGDSHRKVCRPICCARHCQGGTAQPIGK